MADGLLVVLRDFARRDVEDAVDWFRDEVDTETALRFVDSFDAALNHLSKHPRTGSPRYATELELPGLRSWPLDGFPYPVFYVVADDVVDVWRVLHAHRDVPAWLSMTEADDQ